MSQKEASDMIPKVMESLRTLFRYMDAGVQYSNLYKTEAYIWRSIDDADLKIMAEYLCEAATKSRVIATGVRKFVQAHRLLNIGIITIPRFYMSYQHIIENGGFAMPWQKGRQKVAQSQNALSRQSAESQ